MKEAGYVYTITNHGEGGNYTRSSGLKSHLIYKGANPDSYLLDIIAF